MTKSNKWERIFFCYKDVIGTIADTGFGTSGLQNDNNKFVILSYLVGSNFLFTAVPGNEHRSYQNTHSNEYLQSR